MEKLYNMQLAIEYAKAYDMKIALPIFHAMYGPHCDIFQNSKLKMNDRAKITLQNFFNMFKQSLGGCLDFEKLVKDGYLVPTVTTAFWGYTD